MSKDAVKIDGCGCCLIFFAVLPVWLVILGLSLLIWREVLQ